MKSNSKSKRSRQSLAPMIDHFSRIVQTIRQGSGTFGRLRHHEQAITPCVDNKVLLGFSERVGNSIHCDAEIGWHLALTKTAESSNIGKEVRGEAVFNVHGPGRNRSPSVLAGGSFGCDSWSEHGSACRIDAVNIASLSHGVADERRGPSQPIARLPIPYPERDDSQAMLECAHLGVAVDQHSGQQECRTTSSQVVVSMNLFSRGPRSNFVEPPLPSGVAGDSNARFEEFPDVDGQDQVQFSTSIQDGLSEDQIRPTCQSAEPRTRVMHLELRTDRLCH